MRQSSSLPASALKHPAERAQRRLVIIADIDNLKRKHTYNVFFHYQAYKTCYFFYNAGDKGEKSKKYFTIT